MHSGSSYYHRSFFPHAFFRMGWLGSMQILPCYSDPAQRRTTPYRQSNIAVAGDRPRVTRPALILTSAAGPQNALIRRVSTDSAESNEIIASQHLPLFPNPMQVPLVAGSIITKTVLSEILEKLQRLFIRCLDLIIIIMMYQWILLLDVIIIYYAVHVVQWPTWDVLATR
ncbi:hypothetical protein BGW36DRAFT_373171 [Talaromyces proteolyticus]|uniref:Uncharacterized protein n=1 Tax=Talaromyces proteolyticus TaxID=1131652 RepID=A0AAD4PZG4_9EURO|nr:uncharacterized protein BGW36DRAFT_373171 [Talaromyces proteolyticus]KAH8702590.1 hypothetical protein BGW36DRAFT_373171 [Talaromyces proteolyticus]